MAQVVRLAGEYSAGAVSAEVNFLNLSIEKFNREAVARSVLPKSALDEHWGCTLHATAVDHPQRFRLVITEADDEYRDFLQVDEVQDRRAFVGAFCAEFERMLEKEYQLLPDDDGRVFDLRSLPLERLKLVGEGESRMSYPLVKFGDVVRLNNEWEQQGRAVWEEMDALVEMLDGLSEEES